MSTMRLRGLLWGLGLLAIIAILLPLARPTSATIVSDKPEGMHDRMAMVNSSQSHLRIAGYNIRHGTGIDGLNDLSRVGQVLQDLDADITVLTEVDDGWARSGRVDQLAVLAEQLDMPYRAFAPALKRWPGPALYGVGLLSRFPIHSVTVHRLPRHGFQEPRLLLEAKIILPDGSPLRVLGTHLSLDASERLQQAEVLVESGQSGSRSVLMGDFNDTPDSEAYKTVTAAWKDTFTLVGEGSGDTFPSDRPQARIDYVFVSPDLASAPQSFGLVHTQASDHLPVVVDLDLHDPVNQDR